MLIKRIGNEVFKIIRKLVEIFYIKIELIGNENLKDEPLIIVGNHCQIHGPIACELYLPENCYTWCAGEMMKLKEVPPYAYKDFWSQKPKLTRPFYRLLSYLIAPLSVLIFNNARAIPVYRDMRILSTFKSTVKKLSEGKSVVIFPECNEKNNNILYKFQENFIEVAKLYHKKTGKEISFVPLYIAPNLKKMYLGKPTIFCHDSPISEEKKRICEYITQQITEIAQSLPIHTVVPYRNISKRLYPLNKNTEVDTNEKADSRL